MTYYKDMCIQIRIEILALQTQEVCFYTREMVRNFQAKPPNPRKQKQRIIIVTMAKNNLKQHHQQQSKANPKWDNITLCFSVQQRAQQNKETNPKLGKIFTK